MLFRCSALQYWRGRAGLTLVALGEILITSRVRPVSDFYFPVIWLGYILFLDATAQTQLGWSLATRYRRYFLAMFPVSAAVWWLFEWLNLAVHNWLYIGGDRYGNGFGFVSIASVDFSTVLPAVWCTALCVFSLFPTASNVRTQLEVPSWAPYFEFLLGIVSFAAPIAFPEYAFGLIWICVGLLVDPINCWLSRPSVLAYVWHLQWKAPLSFALGALTCGLFWESWNYWAMPKWIYSIPYVGWFRVFEMPILGYSGYLPFGLELLALTYFLFPLVRTHPPVLHPAENFRDVEPTERVAS